MDGSNGPGRRHGFFEDLFLACKEYLGVCFGAGRATVLSPPLPLHPII